LNRRVAVLSLPRKFGLGFVVAWFLIGGIAHFAATSLEMRIVPPWIPWPRGVVLLTGVFEILGALGVLFTRTRAWAGLGLFALTIAVTPANVYMLQRPELFNIPYWILVVRLPVQLGLLWLIQWATGPFKRLR
jgi:uncharacterized membrane protein